MTRRGIGWALVGLGVVSLIAGVIGLAGGATPDDGQAVDTTVAGTTADTTSTTEGTTTSTDIATTTSTTAATTTTISAETAEQFIGEFATAVEGDDSDFLFSRLHPVVFEIHDEELCRGWIAERS